MNKPIKIIYTTIDIMGLRLMPSLSINEKIIVCGYCRFGSICRVGLKIDACGRTHDGSGMSHTQWRARTPKLLKIHIRKELKKAIEECRLEIDGGRKDYKHALRRLSTARNRLKQVNDIKGEYERNNTQI